jgi:Tfp pilus assembly protein PilZ
MNSAKDNMPRSSEIDIVKWDSAKYDNAKMPNYEEQRKYPRVNTEISITAKAVRRTMFEGKVLSLSEGGAFLATEERLLVGSEVILFLTLDLSGRQKSCMVQGKVVWYNGEKQRGVVGCGVAFSDSSASMKRLIHDFVGQKMSATVTAMGVAEGPKKPPTRGQLRG